MADAAEDYSGTYPDELADLMVGMRSLADAEDDYATAHDYFTGEVPEHFASRRLARRVAATGTSFRVNVSKKAVTSVSNRMEVGSVSVPGAEELTRRLQADVWDANELGLELPEWLERLGEYGDMYGFVWPGDEPGTVDIHFSGPLTTRAIYDPENPRRIAYVIKWWTEGTGQRRIQRVNLYYFGRGREDTPGHEVGRIEKWATREGTNGTEAEHWFPWTGKDDTDPAVIENPHGQIVYHFRTARPYGIPLHKDAYGPQDALNKIIVSLMGTVDFHLIPQRAALTEGTTEAEDDDDDFDDFAEDDDPDAAPLTESQKLARDGTSRLRSGPGELWILKNVKNLVSLPTADPHNFLDPADFFLRMMATVTDIPLHFYDPGGDQPSGDSRRQSEGTLTKKVDRLCDSVEATLSGLLAKAMQMLGYRQVTRVEVRWAPSEVTDDGEGWTTAKAKIDAGVPVAQVLQEMGYDATQVEGWLKSNDEQDLRRRIALLAELGKATRDLGAGVGMGLLKPEVVQQVMEAFLLVDTAPADDDAA